jgi:hypothetical protein
MSREWRGNTSVCPKLGKRNGVRRTAFAFCRGHFQPLNHIGKYEQSATSVAVEIKHRAIDSNRLNKEAILIILDG